MNIYETENLSFGDSCKNTRLFSTPIFLFHKAKRFSPTQCVHPLDIIRSTTKLLEIRSSKEENGADKEGGSGIGEDIIVVAKGRGNKCKYTH